MTTMAPLPAEVDDALLAGYRGQVRNGYDELLDPSGNVRPHWCAFISGLGALSKEERRTRGERQQRRVRETGIAYDIFADPNGRSQRWHLDLAPVVISSGEWHWLEAALVQRARLFDALLSDIYGERRLMRQGLVPPELLFSDDAYLRVCQDIVPRAGGLRFYAADLARGPDGQWRIIDSHTETLAGVGFAIANRVVHTHVAGDLFNRCNAVRLASYFQNLQSALTAHAGREDARIALLTPGPHHQDYFSHAYLARYLGYLLVEGTDLRTRGDQVYLKTLEGLKQIDLIVRCVEGRAIDPLELDPGGFQGPAGLLRICRGAPGLVVNAVGTAVVQNRALSAFLPQLAHHLLGEDLALHDAPRLWLGHDASRRRVLDDLGSYYIRAAQEGTGRPGQAASARRTEVHSAAERSDLEREIGLFGAGLVAERRMGFSSAPVLREGGLAPSPFAIRLFVARMADGYRAMPGGLAMTVDREGAVALTAPDGETRDVWVTSDATQAPHVSLWRPTLETARVARSQRAIQSRVADDLFWLGRYAERADWTMRVLRSALRRVEEDSGPATGQRAARQCLEVLLESKNSGLEGRHGISERAAIERLSHQLVSDRRAPRALVNTLEGLYRVAHLIRDRLSLEVWHTLSRFRPGDTWSRAVAGADPVEMMHLLDEGLGVLAAFNGLMHENMTRNFGWSFLDLGRRLERAFNLSEAIGSLFIPMPDAESEMSSLLLLLELADSFITYRSRYRLDPMLALVLDLLVLDEANPRSIAFQLTAAARHLQSLPNGDTTGKLAEDRWLVERLVQSIRAADPEAIARDRSGHILQALMGEQSDLLPELSDAIARHYFNLTDEAPSRVRTRVTPKP